MLADKAQFYLKLSIADIPFGVTHLESKNYQLSRHYQWQVEIFTKNYLKSQALLNTRAHLIFDIDDNKYYYHGIIAGSDYFGPTPQGYHYCIFLHSPLAILKIRQQSQIFLNKTIKEIIEELLTTAGFLANQYSFKLDKTYPQLAYTVQYNERDLEFMERLASRYGLFYGFTQDESHAQIIFYDNCAHLSGLTAIGFEPLSGHSRPFAAIYKIKQKCQLLSQHVELTAYNDATPESVLSAHTSNATAITGMHTIQYSDGHFDNQLQGEHLAQVHQEMLDCQRQTFVAESDCITLRLGQLIHLSNHREDTYNRLYRVIAIKHLATENNSLSAIDKTYRYYNKLLLISHEIPFRARCKAIAPKFHGIWCGRIEGNLGDPYGAIDEQGYYRVRMPFAAQTPNSLPLRLLQSYGDASCEGGLHYPLHAGTLVAIVCINGDIDRPVILGMIPNPEQPSPVTASNQTQYIIRTSSCNELRFDDRENNYSINLHTRLEKNRLTLNATTTKHSVELASIDGSIDICAGKTIDFQCYNDQRLQAEKQHAVDLKNYQHLWAHRLTLRAQKITLFAKQHFAWQAIYLNYQSRYLEW